MSGPATPIPSDLRGERQVTTLLELAERCEAATEASRDLADEVLLACGWRLNHDADEIALWRSDPGTCEGEDGKDYPVTIGDRMNWSCWYAPGNRPFRDSWIDGHYRPNPLASLDAAMTLIPNDTGWTHWSVVGKRPTVALQTDGAWGTYRGGETVALALCSACLRARASLLHSGEIER